MSEVTCSSAWRGSDTVPSPTLAALRCSPNSSTARARREGEGEGTCPNQPLGKQPKTIRSRFAPSRMGCCRCRWATTQQARTAAE